MFTLNGFNDILWLQEVIEIIKQTGLNYNTCNSNFGDCIVIYCLNRDELFQLEEGFKIIGFETTIHVPLKQLQVYL